MTPPAYWTLVSEDSQDSRVNASKIHYAGPGVSAVSRPGVSEVGVRVFRLRVGGRPLGCCRVELVAVLDRLKGMDPSDDKAVRQPSRP